MLRVQARLQAAREGYEMLERKRQILVLELMSRVEASRQAREAVQQQMAAAFEALRAAAGVWGAERLVRDSHGVAARHTLQVGDRSVMGVPVPSVNFEPGAQALPFGLAPGGAGADKVLQGFRDALTPIARLAEVENALLRLAREVKRTQRRVNALEQTFIPDYEETLKFIRESLEEREREDLVIMKKVKTRRQEERLVVPDRRRPEGDHG